MNKVNQLYFVPAIFDLQMTAPNRTKEEDEEEEEDNPASRFTARLLRWLFDGFLAKDKNVRFRVLQTVAEMIAHLGAIEYVNPHYHPSLNIVPVKTITTVLGVPSLTVWSIRNPLYVTRPLYLWPSSVVRKTIQSL